MREPFSALLILIALLLAAILAVLVYQVRETNIEREFWKQLERTATQSETESAGTVSPAGRGTEGDETEPLPGPPYSDSYWKQMELAVLRGSWNANVVVVNEMRELAMDGIRTVSSALSSYLHDVGVEPHNDFDLAVLRLPPDDGGGPNGPYLETDEDLVDPWGHPYVCVLHGAQPRRIHEVVDGPDGRARVEYRDLRYEIVSYGADGLPSGVSIGADIMHYPWVELFRRASAR